MDDLTPVRYRRIERTAREVAAQACRALAESFDRAADEILAGTLTRSAEDLMAEAIEAVKAVGRHQSAEAAAAEQIEP